MACCAFAVMILMQLLAPVLWLRRRLRPDHRRNAAASWRLQPVAATAAVGPGLPRAKPDRAAPDRNRWRPRRWVAAVATTELALLLAAGSFFLPDRATAGAKASEHVWSDEEIWYEAMHDAWCRALDLDRAAG